MQTKRFVQDLKDEIQYEKSYKYQVPFEDSEYYEVLAEVISSSLEDKRLVPSYFDFIRDLSAYHFEYCAFAYTDLVSKEKALYHLEQSVAYASVLLQEAPKTCGCIKGHNPFVVSNKATFMSSLLLLTGEEKAFHVSVKNLIDSLNGKNCIIKKGYNKATISWFVLRLFGIYTNEEITLHKLLQPKDNFGYNAILDTWDSEDEATVEKNLYLLCEIHLAQASLDLADADEHVEDDIYNLRYRELFLPALYSFPYEIFTWLKLRELKGLENPTNFSHPLMNSPLSKMFLEIKEPLPRPAELPYAKELLQKLKGQCPEVEIPEWIEAFKEVAEPLGTPEHPIIRSGETAPKSGIYQAYLPPEHPYAQRVHANPASARLCIEGMEMSPLGLEPEIEDEIRWEWVRE